MLPTHFDLTYSFDEIEARVSALGAEINFWAENTWKESHTDLLTIPVLRGGIFFFADLVREIPRSVEIAPARTWAYQSSVNNERRADVTVNLEGVPAKGRHILLVDDICDSGRTLATLKDALLRAGALDVRAAVLIRRAIEKPHFMPEWVGFEYSGNEWFVGYGMEDSNRWRNLKDIYIIRQVVE